MIRLNEASLAAASARVSAQLGAAGVKAGAAASAAMTGQMATAMTSELSRLATATEGIAGVMGARWAAQLERQGAAAAVGFGTAFGSQLARSVPMVSGFASAMAGYESKAAMAGAVAGRAMGMGFTAAAGGIIGAAGYTLFKGFQRYETIDAARMRLENMNKVLEAHGRTAIDVGRTIQTVNDVVQGTPFALDKAFSIGTRALSSPTGDLKRFMTDVADIAGFTQNSFENVGEAMLNIANRGYLMRRDLHNQLKGMPESWLADTLHLSTHDVSKMIPKRQIGLEDVMRAIEEHTGGFAKAAGNTVQGAIQNVRNAISRTGEGVLSSLFGDPRQGSSLVETVKSITARLDDVGRWVAAHREDIRNFFHNGVDVAKDLIEVLGHVLKVLADHKEAVYGVVIAFASWKAISGVAALIESLTVISTMLGVSLPAAAASAGASISAAFAAVSLPAWYLAMLPLLGGDSAQNQPQGPTNQLKAKSDALEGWSKANPGKATGKDLGDRYNAWLGGRGPIPDELKPFFKDPANASGVPFFDAQGRPLDASGKPFSPAIPGPADPTIPKSVRPFQDEPGPRGSGITTPEDDDDGGKKPHLPKAPVVGYDEKLPPGFENLPLSSSLYGAESSFLDSRHKLAEKRARLAQLERDGAATEQDVLDARNDVATAARDLQQSELRLYEARQDIFDKQHKQLKSWLSELGDIGAGLDQDFGISKGLAGIAENVTKFIASLAAAPILGKLAASQMVAGYKPGEAGQGAVGMLAMSGAFGPQYQIPGSITEEMLQQASAGRAGTAGLTGKDKTVASIVEQARLRGYTEDDIAAIVATAIGESGLDPNAANGDHKGLFQQDASYSGRGTMQGQIAGFLDRLDGTRGGSLLDRISRTPAQGGVQGGGYGPDWIQQFMPQAQSAMGRVMSAGYGGITGGSGGAGGSYGLAAGVNSGGYGGKGVQFPDWVNQLGAMFGVSPSTYSGHQETDRHEAGFAANPQHQNRGIDWSGPVANMQRFAEYVASQGLEQVIWQNPNTGQRIGIAGGRDVTNSPYYAGDYGDHGTHVHTRQSSPIPLPGMGMGIGLDGVVPGGGGGYGVQSAGFGTGGGVGNGLGGGGGGSDLHGAGLPGLPGTSNPTRIGGVAQPQNKGGGLSPGGLPMAAAMAGIGAMTGGAGAAAAQSAMQLINRSIQFGGQLVGIGVQGLGETFLPAGSNLAANSWFTKITGALAGASPMLPNIAGKGDGDGPTPESVVGQGQGLDGRPAGVGDMGMKNVDNSNTKNVNVTNNNTFNAANMNEQSMAQTVADHANAMYT